MTMGHIGEEFRPFTWVGEGWSTLRERAHNALTPFRHDAPVESDSSEASDDSSAAPPAARASWGLVAADVTEFDDRVEVRIEIPGMSRDDLRVEVRGGRLAVSGEKRTQHTRNEGNVVVTERAFGHFYRTVPLPLGVVAESASAGYEDGVLSVTLERSKDARSHRVPVA